MLRRRRPHSGEIAFSFDSFLDLVANVVGVILRLILVAWVGARTYTGVFKPSETTEELEPAEVAMIGTPEPKLSTDAEKSAIDQAKKQLADARAALLEHLREQDDLQKHRQEIGRQLAQVRGTVSGLKEKAIGLDTHRQEVEREQTRVELSLAEIRSRVETLRGQLVKLEKQPSAKHVLRYQTPIARTVQSEEMHFEVKNGRVTFLDVEAMLREIKQGLQARGEELRGRYELREETAPAGAFRLRYVIARERGLIDSVTASALPAERDNFRFGLEGWEAVPVQAERGETADQALRVDSEFRRLADHIDATQTAITFWVYPDSFPVYRQLRDYCVRRDLLVAGRPLPEGVPIASSRNGSASRGQ